MLAMLTPRRLALAALAAVALTAPAQAQTVEEPTVNSQFCFTNLETENCEVPGPPPCDVDTTWIGPNDRVCTLAAPKDFVFEAIDLNTGPNKCTATLKASAPEDQADPANRPKIGYRVTVTCEKTIRIINFTSTLHRAAGGLYHTAGSKYCHGNCTTSYTIRGDVYAQRNQAFIVRVPIHMRLWEGPDPWIATPPDAQDNNGPASCKPGGYDVYCLLELPVTTADQNPSLPPIPDPKP